MHHIETDFPKCLSGVNKFLRLNRLELAAKSYVFNEKGLTISKQILRFEYTLSILCRYCFRIISIGTLIFMFDFIEFNKSNMLLITQIQFSAWFWWIYKVQMKQTFKVYKGSIHSCPLMIYWEVLCDTIWSSHITYRGIHVCTTKKYLT